MKNFARATVCAIVMVAGLNAAPNANADVDGNSQGCTPGSWTQSQHFDSWQEAQPTQLFTAKFGFTSAPASLSGVTMLQALQGGGGSSLDGARQILARAATAAYLNAAYDAPDGSAMLFPWRREATGYNGEPPLVPTVRAALTGSSRGAMLDLAAQLDMANNLGCPLS